MGLSGKLRGLGKKAATTAYSKSGVKSAVRDVRTGVSKLDKHVSGGGGLRSNVRKLKKAIKSGQRGY